MINSESNVDKLKGFMISKIQRVIMVQIPHGETIMIHFVNTGLADNRNSSYSDDLLLPKQMKCDVCDLMWWFV